MESEKDNRDWLNEYPSLKQVNANSPFTVPDGYFDELHQRAMSRAFLDSASAPGEGFITPENYFEELPGQIQSRIFIDAALQNDSAGFIIPENYFENMQSALGSRIRVEAAIGGRGEGLTVPDDFFEAQQAQIMSRIAVEEVLNVQDAGFTVPEGYFDRLQNRINAKTTVIERSNRGAVIRKLIHKAAFKYAAAACLTLVVGLGWFIGSYESPQAVHNRSYIHKALVKVSDDDIIEYLQTHMDAADTRSLMNGVEAINADGAGADDIKDYLSTH